MDNVNKNESKNNEKLITELAQKISVTTISNVIENKFNEYKHNSSNSVENSKKMSISRFKRCYLCKIKIINNDKSATFHAYDNTVCKKCYVNLNKN